MHVFSVFYVHEQQVFTCKSFVFNELLVIKVGHREVLLVLDVATDR